MSILESIIARARQDPRRVVFPESHDARVLRAVSHLARDGIVEPVLLGNPGEVSAKARSTGVDLRGVAIENPSSSPERDACHRAAADALEGKGLDAAAIAELLEDPLYYAAAMVRAGRAAGSLAPGR